MIHPTNSPKEIQFIITEEEDGIKITVKGQFRVTEVWLYDVLLHSQCINYSRWRSASPQFGEADRSPSRKLSNVLLWTGKATKQMDLPMEAAVDQQLLCSVR